MPRIVQKYGGTSVGDVERIKKVAERIKSARAEGHQIVVVLSARAGVTNKLIARAKGLCAEPSDRELDQLLAIGEQESIALMAMALHGIGVPAISYTGAQAGIFTDKVHTEA
jgi:aspartate kinase